MADARANTSIDIDLHLMCRVGEEGDLIEIGTVDLHVPLVFSGTTIKIDQRELHAQIVKALRSIE